MSVGSTLTIMRPLADIHRPTTASESVENRKPLIGDSIHLRLIVLQSRHGVSIRHQLPIRCVGGLVQYGRQSSRNSTPYERAYKSRSRLPSAVARPEIRLACLHELRTNSIDRLKGIRVQYRHRVWSRSDCGAIPALQGSAEVGDCRARSSSVQLDSRQCAPQIGVTCRKWSWNMVETGRCTIEE
jgi:hypothetical protein